MSKPHKHKTGGIIELLTSECRSFPCRRDCLRREQLTYEQLGNGPTCWRTSEAARGRLNTLVAIYSADSIHQIRRS